MKKSVFTERNGYMTRKINEGDIINVGVIGCGQIAQMMHLPYITHDEHLRLYSICDISQNILDNVGAKYHVPAEHRYLDAGEMVKDDKLDAVVIATNDHYDPAVKAAKAGKHMLVEKPFMYSVAECDEVIALCKENNLILQVGYMKRHDPGFQYAFEKIKTLKDVNLVRVHDYGGSFDFTTQIYDLYPKSDLSQETLDAIRKKIDDTCIAEIGEDRADIMQSYSLICGLSSHDTILMRHCFGYPEVLFAYVPKPGFVTAFLRFENGVQGILESGLVMNRRSWDESIWVYSNECNLSIHFPWPYLKNAPTIVKINENEPGSMVNYDQEVIGSFDEAYRREWKHFYQCIVEGKEPINSGADARNDIKLASDIIRAVKI